MAYLQVRKGKDSISVAFFLFSIIFTVFSVPLVSATSSNTTSTVTPGTFPPFISKLNAFVNSYKLQLLRPLLPSSILS